MEALGLLTKRTTSAPSRSAFASSRRSLRLIVDDVDEIHPNDISYVYSGYAPMSVRLVQCAMQKLAGGSIGSTGASAVSLLSYVGGGTATSLAGGNANGGSNNNNINGNSNNSMPGATITQGWRGYEEVMRALPGKSFEITQTVEYGPETNAAMARARRMYY